MGKLWKSTRPLRRLAEVFGYGWSAFAVVVAAVTAISNYLSGLAPGVIATFALMALVVVLAMAALVKHLARPSSTVPSTPGAGSITAQYAVDQAKQLAEDVRIEREEKEAIARELAELKSLAAPLAITGKVASVVSAASASGDAKAVATAGESLPRFKSVMTSLDRIDKAIDRLMDQSREIRARHDAAVNAIKRMDSLFSGRPRSISDAINDYLAPDLTPEQKITQAQQVISDYYNQTIKSTGYAPHVTVTPAKSGDTG